MVYLLLIIGFVLLIKGADLFVDGSASIANKLKISKLVIGLTVVAFGTSAPELVVNVMAGINGNTSLAIGNIIGSNTLNILLILGLSSIIYPIKAQKSTVIKEIPFSLLGILVIFVAASDALFDGFKTSVISRTEGMLFIGFFIIFLYYIFSMIKDNNDVDEVDIREMSYFKAISFIVLGLAGLVIGGKWIVDSSVTIAKTFHIDETVIGLTIIAIGTSLPELATSLIAAYKKQTDIVIGNVVGSNIFNTFWILGVSSIIKPLPFDNSNNIDLYVCIYAHLILFLTMYIGKKQILERWEGILLFLSYLAYIVYRLYV